MVPEKISMTPQRRAYLGRSVPGAAVGSVLGENHPFLIILQSENDQGSIFGGIIAERGRTETLAAVAICPYRKCAHSLPGQARSGRDNLGTPRIMEQ